MTAFPSELWKIMLDKSEEMENMNKDEYRDQRKAFWADYEKQQATLYKEYAQRLAALHSASKTQRRNMEDAHFARLAALDAEYERKGAQ